MSAISQKSISGITSITSPAGTDDQISLHTSNTNEALKIDGAGNLHLNNHVNTTGVTTASNFKTGSSNLHSTGLTVGDTFVHSTGINGSSADIDDFISVGNNIHLGNAGVITATSFSGDGSQLSGIDASALKFGAATKVQATNTGAVVTGILTATSFSGDGSSLSNLPAGAPVGGASTNTVFFENDKAVAVNYQITSTKNAMSAGPIAINAGIAVTVPSGCSWTIV